ncbi:MAG: hypothetical protein ACLSW4_02610 [Clostridia bacterium]|nr:hypothetical protein [Clostridiaceae bacterium]
MGNIILVFIFAVALTIVVYETYYEKKEKKIGRLLAPKVELLIEMSSKKIFEKQTELNRELTEAEKNKILDECYSKI